MAIVFILGLAGFAASVIPQACRSGMMACDGKIPADQLELIETVDAAPAPQGAVEALTAVAEDTSSAPAPVVRTAMVEQPPAPVIDNDIVARTFDALNATLVITQSELSSRSVRTVAIGPDGQPVGESDAAPEIAPLEPAEPLSSEPPATEPEPVPEVEQPSTPPVAVAEVSQQSSSEDVGATAYAPVRDGGAVVTGKGANVRSLPQRGGSQVLFALAGGEEVTVVEMSKGWARIVDSRGRNGWIYGDYLRR